MPTFTARRRGSTFRRSGNRSLSALAVRAEALFTIDACFFLIALTSFSKTAEPLTDAPANALASNAELPGLVRQYLERVLPLGGSVPTRVRVTQDGEMRQKPVGRPLRFTAVEEFAVEEVAFSWRARFPVVGPLAITVIDDYGAGEGKLEARILGFPVQRQRGRETVIGEALRYLAELPWAPHAMAHNRELEWRQLDDASVEVATPVGGERLVVKIEFDNSGDIVRISSQMRLLKVGEKWVPKPWAGDSGEYAVVGDTRLPTRAEVYWDLDEGRFVYWRGRITSAELLDEPFESGPQRHRTEGT